MISENELFWSVWNICFYIIQNGGKWNRNLQKNLWCVHLHRSKFLPIPFLKSQLNISMLSRTWIDETVHRDDDTHSFHGLEWIHHNGFPKKKKKKEATVNNVTYIQIFNQHLTLFVEWPSYNKNWLSWINISVWFNYFTFLRMSNRIFLIW